MEISHQAPPLSVISLTTAKRPRRYTEPLCSASSVLTRTFAAAGLGVGTLPSKIRAIASAACARLGRDCAQTRPASSVSTADSTGPDSDGCTACSIGGSAAVPGVGTAAALALAAGDTSWFLTAASLYVLCAAEIRGIKLETFEHEKALVLTVLTAGGGSTFFGKAAQRTGRRRELPAVGLLGRYHDFLQGAEG